MLIARFKDSVEGYLPSLICYESDGTCFRASVDLGKAIVSVKLDPGKSRVESVILLTESGLQLFTSFDFSDEQMWQ